MYISSFEVTYITFIHESTEDIYCKTFMSGTLGTEDRVMNKPQIVPLL